MLILSAFDIKCRMKLVLTFEVILFTLDGTVISGYACSKGTTDHDNGLVNLYLAKSLLADNISIYRNEMPH